MRLTDGDKIVVTVGAIRKMAEYPPMRNALEEAFPEAFEEDPVVVGQRYRLRGEECIVTKIFTKPPTYCLVLLREGLSWTNPTTDMNQIWGNTGRDAFTLIK